MVPRGHIPRHPASGYDTLYERPAPAGRRPVTRRWAILGWRGSLLAVGALGIAAALALSTQGTTLVDRLEPIAWRPAPSAGLGASVKVLMAPSILTAFAFFALIAMSLIGIQTFSVSAMVAIFDAPLGLATGALTAFLLGSALGILAGGFLADRTSRHDVVAGGGLVLGAALALVIVSAVPSLAVLPVHAVRS